MLDFETCNQARLRRDAAFDGRFFVAVKTTSIYCRPVCSVKQPLTKNVSFYASAAAAEQAGYRPCLRCRPETAPFCPAWKGTRTTVERALALLQDGALDRGTVEELAEKLGVGPRHLSRLFRQHLGASPQQTAKTLRIQRAKRLLDNSSLSIGEIAFQSGFHSVRRFNAAFSELYDRPPSALRKRPRAAERLRAVPRSDPETAKQASDGQDGGRPANGWRYRETLRDQDRETGP
ncbi:bifunctional transcriptional activator/DNA repair enzyme AdaA [Algihabitans albus]|uniref:bifunctional transcriptional activator/DNA repair enzyme AdaA n=1 Tax=Algihabitans albus TaxID=2164067 RepID=UPI000E5CFBE7|nr:Ada metal-binding domain-containing protein [Algihabitans albus]